MNNKIILSLDTHDEIHALELLKTFKGHLHWVKIGMEAFYSLGPPIIFKAHQLGYQIFLDLKLHDIPNTAQKAITSLSTLPVSMTTVHAMGGMEMMKQVVLAAKKNRPSLKILAVTHLTSSDQTMLSQELGIQMPLKESVKLLAGQATQASVHGFIASGHEALMLKTLFPNHLVVTPGIRLNLQDHDDQKRILTPKMALQNGADYLVIGRPLTQSSTPIETLNEIIKN